MLTKHVPAELLQRHLETLCTEVRGGRAETAPELNSLECMVFEIVTGDDEFGEPLGRPCRSSCGCLGACDERCCKLEFAKKKEVRFAAKRKSGQSHQRTEAEGAKVHSRRRRKASGEDTAQTQGEQVPLHQLQSQIRGPGGPICARKKNKQTGEQKARVAIVKTRLTMLWLRWPASLEQSFVVRRGETLRVAAICIETASTPLQMR